MNKRKHSHSETLIPPKNLLFEEKRFYTSPFPLQECASRLMEAGQKRTWLGNNVLVNVIPRDENEFEFILRTHNNGPNGWFVGMLQPSGQNSTLVSGKCGVGGGIVVRIFIYIAIYLLAAVLVISMMLLGSGGIQLIFLAGIIVMGLWVIVYLAKSQVLAFIKIQLNT